MKNNFNFTLSLRWENSYTAGDASANKLVVVLFWYHESTVFMCLDLVHLSILSYSFHHVVLNEKDLFQFNQEQEFTEILETKVAADISYIM